MGRGNPQCFTVDPISQDTGEVDYDNSQVIGPDKETPYHSSYLVDPLIQLILQSGSLGGETLRETTDKILEALLKNFEEIIPTLIGYKNKEGQWETL